VGRIRTIKPEVLTDAKSVKLGDMAWRLWVSTWLMADDEGRFPADPLIVAGQIFPGRSSASVEKALGEVVRAGMITLYQVNGDRFGQINGWRKHQKINRPSPARFPAPCEPFTEDSLNPHGGLTEGSCEDLDLDLDLDLDRGGQTPTETRASRAREFARQAIAELNRLRGSKFQATAKQALSDSDQLAKDYTPQQAVAVIRDRFNEWDGDPKMEKHLNPGTLLRPKNFRRYLENLEGLPDGEGFEEDNIIALEFGD